MNGVFSGLVSTLDCDFDRPWSLQGAAHRANHALLIHLNLYKSVGEVLESDVLGLEHVDILAEELLLQPALLVVGRYILA